MGDDDGRTFLSMLEVATKKHDWKVFSYCLMPNHFHLMIQTARPTRSIGMQWLKGSYAPLLQRRPRRRRASLQGRFGSKLVENDWHLFEVGRYLALNPVEAGLTSTPEAWKWSSYGATIGVSPVPSSLHASEFLFHFARERETAVERFSRFVRDGLRD